MDVWIRFPRDELLVQVSDLFTNLIELCEQDLLKVGGTVWGGDWL